MRSIFAPALTGVLERADAVFGLGPATRVYLAVEVTDMRKGFEGLYGRVRGRLSCDAVSGHLFLFCNAQRNRLKVLAWGMVADSAIPLQKTHSIAFESRQVCYPWHRWYGRNVLTRKAGGAQADVAYLCKLPEAPLDAMLVETPKWMFDAAHCATIASSGTASCRLRDAACSEELASRTTCLLACGVTTAAIPASPRRHR